jgi:hypothetical protein
MRIAALAAPVAVAAAALAGGGTAHAAVTPTTVTAVTHVINRPDNGHGTPPVWAYDTFARTLTVTLAAPQPKGTPAGDLAYDVTITDKGGFSTVGGAGTPNQAAPGLKVAHNGVRGSVNGSYALTATAPEGDTLTGIVPATENDNFSSTGAGFVSTGDWAKQAFASPAGVVVGGGKYSWTYATACEKWVDSSANGDGNTANDGNITGKTCEPAPAPYVYAGHVVNVTQHTATVGWSESVKGWPSDNHCVEVYMFGFDTPPGVAHVGFTCDNGNRAADLGYLRNLAAGHSVSLFVRPAEGNYGSHHPIPGTDAKAHVYVVTPR